MKIRKITWVTIALASFNVALPICFPESNNVVSCVCGWVCYILMGIHCNFKDNYIEELLAEMQAEEPIDKLN